MKERPQALMMLAVAALVLTACDSPGDEADPAPADAASVESSSPSADALLRPGAQLYDDQGVLWGTVVEVSDAHRFGNGVVEPGVLVDYGPRMGNPPVPPQWLPRRSAERFTIR